MINKKGSKKSHQKNGSIHFSNVFPLIAFLVLVGMSFLVWQEVKKGIDADLEESFNIIANETVIRLEAEIEEDLDALYGARGLFWASERVDRSEWKNYIRSLTLEERFPGIQAIEFVSRVANDDKEKFIEEVRLDTSLNPEGYPDFDIHPEVRDHEEHFVVNFIEPFLGNEQAFGFDLFSNPERREAIERSRDSGEPVATAPIRLVQGEVEQAGFLIFLPIYRQGADPETVEERRELLEGFVLAVFRAGDMLEDLTSKIATFQSTHLEIIDNTIALDVDKKEDVYNTLFVHNHSRSSYKPKFMTEREIVVGDRTWLLKFNDLGGFTETHGESKLPIFVLIAGLLFSSLSGGILYTYSRTRAKAIKIAKNITKDLEKFQLAIENAYEQIVITDSEGNVVYANPIIEQITGYTVEDALGTKAGKLWGGLMDTKYYENMWHTIKVDKKKYIGEIRNRKKSGEEYDASILISPLLDRNKNVEFFVSIERDITKLKAIDNAKTEFVSLASHQLRTPITGLRWTMERLAGKENLTTKGKEYLRDMHHSMESLSELVDSLLNVSRIETGGIVVAPEEFDLIPFISSYLSELNALKEKKKLTITFSDHPETFKIFSDKNLLRNIVQSIVSNAVEYTPEGGSIAIALEVHKKNFILKIRDSGIGIPKEEYHKVFDKLYRADNAKLFKSGGSGLGMYIAKKAVDLLGGKISFRSAIDEGTTFYVELPIKAKAKDGHKTLL